ncbi:MAG TPA: D-alanyl-D-alanine carboxypeptidase/D-alanyl-D-alanine-endopeptidase [Gaiellaceae bacterium]
MGTRPIFSRLAALALTATLGLALCASSTALELAPQAAQSAGKSAAARTELVRELNAALASAKIPSSQRAAEVIDLTNGEVLFSRHATGPLAPASNEKLPITLAALTLLGPGYRIPTEVLGEGEQQGSEWIGDLVLKGYGDPGLSTSNLKQLARQVRAAGIRSVSGSLIADESFFDRNRTAPGWKSSFLINECAPLSALSVDRGHVTSASPPLVAVRVFSRLLAASGVSVKGDPRPGAASADALSIASVESPPLWKLLRFMDRESDNYSAELMLKQIGAFENEQGTTANGAAAVNTVLSDAGISLAGVRIVDGSGLSRSDRLTATALSQLLVAAWDDATLRSPFVGSLSIAGRVGTLSHRLRLRPAFGNVFAKTGTTNSASALSGYVRDRYAFVILQNGSPVAAARARAAQDRFVTVLAAQ